MVWEPKQCCCGASLRTGTLVLGWLGVIGSALHVLSQLKFAVLTHSDLVEVCKNVSVEQKMQFDPEVCANFVMSTIAISGVIGGVSLIICILLLVGVNKNKPGMMLPYLISNGIGITLMGLVTVIVFFVLAYYGAIGALFIVLVVFGGILSLEIYLFLVVRACYKEVKQHNLAMGGNSDIAYVEQKEAVYNYKI